MSEQFLCKSPNSEPARARYAVRVVGLALLIGGYFTVPARASFWTGSTNPATPEVTDDKDSVTLGLQFYSDVPGSVTAVRFYKGPDNGGAHVGVLWSSTGSKLASVTFAGGSASGWPQANFASPVSISANTKYVISYLAPNGSYADDQNFSWPRLNAAPLHVSGSSPGVYAYGSAVTYPQDTWNDSNYFVDLVFIPAGSASKYSISGKVNGSSGASLSLSGAASGSAKTDSSGNYSFPGLAAGKYLIAPNQAGYAFTPPTAVVSISGGNFTGVNFTAAKTFAHSVSLSWVASVSPNIKGYNVYRSGSSGGPYALVSSSLVSGTTYVDSNVSSGDSYFYVTTAVDASNAESGYSNQTAAVVPTP